MPPTPNGPPRRNDGDDPRIAILRDGTPSEILARLVETDSLGLEARAKDARERGAWLLAVERLRLRGAARVAFEARRRPSEEPLDRWIDRCVDSAVRELLSEQHEEELALTPVSESADAEFYRRIATAMEIELELARLVCARANALPYDRRRVFDALIVQRRTVDDLTRLGWGQPARLLELLEQAVLVITHSIDRRPNGRRET